MEAEEISHSLHRVIELGRHRIWPRLLPHIQAWTSYSRGVLGCPEEAVCAGRVPFSEYVIKDVLCLECSTWFQCLLLYPDISDMVAPMSCSLTKQISKCQVLASLYPSLCQEMLIQMAVVAHACDSSTRGAEAGGSPQVQNHPGLQSETLSPTNKPTLTPFFHMHS